MLFLLLPPANVVSEGYVFTPVCDSVNRWGGGGACVVAPGGCMVFSGGHVWFFQGVHGFSGGHVCFFWGGVHGFSGGGMHSVR